MTEDRLARAVASCLLLAALASAGGLFGYVLVWGGQVAPGWLVSAALLVGSLILATVRARVRRYRARDPGNHEPPPRRSTAWTALAMSVGLISAFGLLNDLPATYTVLRPASSGSCQVAVRESSFLFAGGGDVYAVGFGGLGRSVSSWTADDGYQPVTSGTYDVHWEDERALLSVHGGVGDPVWPTLHDVACP